MNLNQLQLTKHGIGGVVLKSILFAFVTTSLLACSGYASTNGASVIENSPDNSEVVAAAIAEINSANSNGSKDTQCSNYVGAVLRRLGYKVSGFHANDFHEIAAKVLPDWKMTEFTTEDLAAGRASLKQHLNSFPDHTAFFAQWPRNGQSGHVAIVEKISDNSFAIYQAQGGMNTPYKKQVKIEGLLYGTLGVDRSRIRLWTE